MAGKRNGCRHEWFIPVLSNRKNDQEPLQLDTDDWVVLSWRRDVELLAMMNWNAIATYRYRKVKSKTKEQFQLVVKQNSFLCWKRWTSRRLGHWLQRMRKATITDTQKENNLIIHFVIVCLKIYSCKFHATVNRKTEEWLPIITLLLTWCILLWKESCDHKIRKVLVKYRAQSDLTFLHFTKVTDEEMPSALNKWSMKNPWKYSTGWTKEMFRFKAMEMELQLCSEKKYGSVRWVKLLIQIFHELWRYNVSSPVDRIVQDYFWRRRSCRRTSYWSNYCR